MHRAARRVLALLAASLLLPLPIGTEPAFAQDRTIIAAQTAPKRSVRAKAKIKAKAKVDPKAKGKKKKKDKAAQDARAWSASREGGNPVLMYGKGAEETIISFACLLETGLVRVVTIAGTPAGRRAPRPGDGARIRLMAGPTRFELAGTAFTSDTGTTIYVSGTTRIAPRFFALFKRAQTMTVEVPGRTTGISLKGLGPRGEAFERACLAGR